MEKTTKTGRLLAVAQNPRCEREARQQIGWARYARHIRYYARSDYLHFSVAADRDVGPIADSPDAERRRQYRDLHGITRRRTLRNAPKAVHFRMNEGIRVM